MTRVGGSRVGNQPSGDVLLTVEEAKHLRPGDVLHVPSVPASDGGPTRWRVNGKAQVWKTRPDEVRVPVKFGLYTYGALDQDNIHMFEAPPELMASIRERMGSKS